MTKEEAEKHPLWPSFREWIRNANIRTPPVIGVIDDFWLDFWCCYLAGAHESAKIAAEAVRKMGTDVR
jgi:hypothetical protein